MKVVITGGAGFIGAALARELLTKGGLTDAEGRPAQVEKLVIFDQVAPEGLPDDSRLDVVVGQATDAELMADAVREADSIFHFASVVSGGAEADLHLGLSVNLDGTRMLLDLLAGSARFPKLVFASSCAVYGGGAELVTDATTPQPKSSYGVQKLCCELLIGDYARRGLVDGRAMRFPTIAVRPGKANLANSSFISNIVREPLAGRDTVCPVPEDTAISLMSPGRLIAAILKVHNLGADGFGWPKALLLPAINVTVADMLAALDVEAGPEFRKRVQFAPDEKIIPMVKSWPVDIRADRAEALGIFTNTDAREIVREYLEMHAASG